MNTRYIFVTGGVASSLGKGIISSSLATLLKARGYNVTIQKLDPYINIDPGTLNPYEHGECYVTEDGAETDLDLGHYERYLNIPTSQANNITTGRIYKDVIEKERKGEFLGQTVQVIPHITDEIQKHIKILGDSGNYDFVITEIGGTVGDIESFPFIEAIRQLRWELGLKCVSIHLTLVPFLKATGELKTKPTQHSVKTLLEQGVQPDIIVCRTEYELNDILRRKIALFCNVQPQCVMQSIDTESIYDIPLQMQKEGLDHEVLRIMQIPIINEANLNYWENFLHKLKFPKTSVRICLVGKYVELRDAYKSINEAFIHGGVANECKVNLDYIQSEQINKENIHDKLKQYDGILVAPGFGERGIEGKIISIQYAREKQIPFFGICLGMQCAVIEFARNVLGHKDAHSTEVNPTTSYPIIDLIKEQKQQNNTGGTMRLGSYPCELKEDSLAYHIYGQKHIFERHRHRYELNNSYLPDLTSNGMLATGINRNQNLVEIIEIPSHPFFIGVQFHPEYKSTVAKHHPLFEHFVKAAKTFKNNKK